MREPTRYLESVVVEDALAAKKMAFLSGPRQVGKTILGRRLLTSENNYFTWDDSDFRRAWLRSPRDAIAARGPGAVLLDELHKDRKWKSRLKGLYDTRGSELPIVVTGRARLDLYGRGGDSLLGRYLPYRLHPFSVGEQANPVGPDEILRNTQSSFAWKDLLRLGGFPEPLLGANENTARRWSRLRLERLVQEDIRDMRTVSDLQALRVLVELLPERVGSLLSVNALREDVGVAYATVRAWMDALEALYVCFRIKPYANKLARALRAEPKLYLYDIVQIPAANLGARQENLVALHLLKACHYWTDIGAGDFDLRFVRDKEKREVDFLVLRDKKPWMMVECKSNDRTPCPQLVHFAERLGVKQRFQLVVDSKFDREFPEAGVRVMGYERFLAGLV